MADVVGFVSGCFDWLSPGHVRLLRAAHERCDKLHMFMADDETVRHYKGFTRPLLSWGHRAELVQACRYVDGIWRLRKLPGDSNQWMLIRMLRPDIYFEGKDATDQDIGAFLSEFGVERQTLDTEPLHISGILDMYNRRVAVLDEQLAVGLRRASGL